MSFQGLGTQFKLGDGGDPTEGFSEVAKVAEIGELNLSRDTIETTTFDSAGGFKEYIPSLLIEPGELSLVLVWDTEEADHSALRDRIGDALPRNYQITWPGSGEPAVPVTATFAAIVTSVGTPTPIDDRVNLNIGVKITGEIVWS